MKRTLALLPLLACCGAVMQGASAPETTRSREILTLDGTWQIVFDQLNEGRAGHWDRQRTFSALPTKRTIKVPSCWETIEKDYEGVAWYARSFQVPPNWVDKVIRLQFGAINYRAEVWINDQPAGFHEGGYTPFELTISDLLRPGEENFLVVRVLGPVITKNVVLDGIGPNETPHWRGAIAGGIWQSVQIIATPHVYFSDIFVQPDLRANRAVVIATVENATNRRLSAVLGLALAEGAGQARQEVSLRPGRNQVRGEIAIAHPRLWTPDTPALYTLESRLQVQGVPPDNVNQRFGMREFTIREGNYYLNGRKLHLKAAFWEGLYPQTLAFPPNSEVVRREIRMAKEAGFNVLRVWRKPPAPVILDLADEMGMMIIDAPPIECMGYWPQLAPETEHRIAIEVREMVERDRNHASVIYWELFNEVVRPGIARLKRGMSLLAREADPTRIVVDESGGWADGAHAYLPHGMDPEPINEIHSYQPSPVNPRTTNFYLTLGRSGFDQAMLGRSKIASPDGIIFISEVGYGGLPDLPANVAQYKREGNPLTPDYRYHVSLLEGIQKALGEMKLGSLFEDVAALCRSSQRIQADGNKLQLEALRLNPRVNGYCVHAYTDGDWVVGAGLLDLFRNPKLTYHSIKHVQSPLYVAVRVSPSNLREGQSGSVLIDSVNDGEPVRGRLEWEITAPDHRVVLKDGKEVSIAAGVSSLLALKVPDLSVSGEHRARIRLVPQTGATFGNERPFFYLARQDLEVPAAPFALIDPKRELSPILKSAGLHFREFAGGERELIPVLVATDAPPDDASLLAYIGRGGVAIFLNPPAAPVVPPGAAPKPITNPLLRSGRFPLQLQLRLARGNWVPVNHAVRPHPIFAGLPAGDFMGQTYLNVCATETLEGVKTPPIVGSLSFAIHNGSIDRNYLGPGDVWWGSDLVSVPHGKGQIVLSTLHLKENLESDPVAQKLLYNMIQWAASAARH